jgi:hypothetical protein
MTVLSERTMTSLELKRSIDRDISRRLHSLETILTLKTYSACSSNNHLEAEEEMISMIYLEESLEGLKWGRVLLQIGEDSKIMKI